MHFNYSLQLNDCGREKVSLSHFLHDIRRMWKCVSNKDILLNQFQKKFGENTHKVFKQCFI
jgi:hypothetical protein